MSPVQRFVEANRRFCWKLKKRFPRVFDDKSDQDSYVKDVREIVLAEVAEGRTRLLEVGGIDRPGLAKDPRYEYVGMDIEEREGCHAAYDRFIVQSIEEKIDGEFDVIFSVTLLEHVRDNRAAMRRSFEALADGGVACHYFPSKTHPYALCLRMVGPRLQRFLIRTLRPKSVDVTGYPTYFDHCSLSEMTALMREVGYSNIRWKAYYHANGYFAFFVPLFLLEGIFEYACKRLNLTVFAAGITISASREIPERGAGARVAGASRTPPIASP